MFLFSSFYCHSNACSAYYLLYEMEKMIEFLLLILKVVTILPDLCINGLAFFIINLKWMIELAKIKLRTDWLVFFL